MRFQETVRMSSTKLIFSIILSKKQSLIRYGTILVAKCAVDTIYLDYVHPFQKPQITKPLQTSREEPNLRPPGALKAD